MVTNQDKFSGSKPVSSNKFVQVIADFAEFIHRDDSLHTALNHAIGESQQHHCGKEAMRVESLQHMLQLMSEVLSQAPVWTNAEDGLIGCPLNVILRPIMNTTSGWTVLSRADTNEHLRRILETWSQYLVSEESTRCLSGRNGWCTPENLNILGQEAQSAGEFGEFGEFADIFVCPDPSNKSTLGFRSWDDFFTRKFAPDIRPLAGGVTVELHRAVLHPCEASMYRYTTKVKLADRFWLKSQPYSIVDMLDKHWSALSFQDGSVYQAFLSALSYHRWHAPISGTVLSVKRIAGTYFAQAPWFAGMGGMPFSDDAPPNLSQAYLASVATRLLILFDADCSSIGMVAFLAIGMAEVSSCQSLVVEGQHVTAGDEIGMFHYGGSSYCLLFQAGFQSSFIADRIRSQPQSTGNNTVKSLLAFLD